jgi:hypothetical protein
METYVLVPEREFMRSDEVPKFDKTITKIVQEPFRNPNDKADALSKALYQFIEKNNQKEDVGLEITEPRAYVAPRPPSPVRSVSPESVFNNPRQTTSKRKKHPDSAPAAGKDPALLRSRPSRSKTKKAGHPQSNKKSVPRDSPELPEPAVHKAKPREKPVYEKVIRNTRGNANANVMQSGGLSLWR